MLCVANYGLLIRASLVFEGVMVFLLTVLFTLSGQRKRAVIYLGLFSVLFFLDMLLIPMLASKWLSFVSMICVGTRQMLPCFMAGSYLLHTTSSHALIHGLRRWHVPESLLLTVAVLLRFLPTIPETYQTIIESLKVRGLLCSRLDFLKHPIRCFEYLLVPLLMCAIRTSQDLTIATLTKGVSHSGKQTSFIPYRLGKRDWSCLMLLALLVGLMTREVMK